MLNQVWCATFFKKTFNPIQRVQTQWIEKEEIFCIRRAKDLHQCQLHTQKARRNFWQLTVSDENGASAFMAVIATALGKNVLQTILSEVWA